MRMHRIGTVLVATLAAVVAGSGPALADVPIGAAHYVPCPGFTDEPARYRAPERTAYRCHSAVIDPLGNVVILRQGRSDAGPGAFGWLHTLLDHTVDDHVVERIISSSYPRTAPGNRFRYSAEMRVDGHEIMAVWVEIDRKPSADAPDSEPFGVLTAYCKIPYNAGPEEKCPQWVNDSLIA